MSYFAGSNDAKATGATEYAALGVHRIGNIEAKIHPGRKGTFLILEFDILESTTEPQYVRRCELINISPGPNQEFGFTLVKRAVGSILGVPLDQVSERVLDDIVDPNTSNPFEGLTCRLECTTSKNREGRTFTKRVFMGDGRIPESGAAVAPVSMEDLEAPIEPAPPIPSDAPALASPLERALADGWKVHSADESYMFRGTEVAKQETVLERYAA